MPDPDQPPAGPLRVLIVDADDRIRESLSGLLAIGDRVLVVGAAGEASTALGLVGGTMPDVVIVDPRLPDVAAGIAFIGELRTVAPDVRIVAMSWSDTLEHAALAGGADGFIRKTFRPTELVAAIVAAASRPAA